MPAPRGSAGEAGGGSRREAARQRDVVPAALPDLLERPPRATVAFVEAGHVDLLPVHARFEGGSYPIGVDPAVAPALDGREVALVIDDGAYWFERRGISARGRARRLEPARPDAEGPFAWYALEPSRVLAWDYGTPRSSR